MDTPYLAFNISSADGQFLCPACGLAGYFSGTSYTATGPAIGTGICPCCLFEPGFDDDSAASGDAEATVLASITKYRARWVENGMAWRGEDHYWFTMPQDWNPSRQIETLIEIAPWLR